MAVPCGGACYDMCFEADPGQASTSTHWVYAGEGRGAYKSNTEITYVGEGMGAYNKEVVTNYGGWRLRPLWLLCCLLLPLLAFLGWWFWPRPARGEAPTEPDCVTGYGTWEQSWTADQAALCCSKFGRGCPQQVHYEYVPVPAPAPHFQYNCNAGFSNWYFGWSDHKKGWCCRNANKGCPGTWHGSYQFHAHMIHGVGHAHGRIYDCAAGFSNWMQGWSDSKKDWCCTRENRGCVKFHCTGDAAAASTWAHDKSEWCCANFQKGCPRTTLSALKCDAECHAGGTTSKCIDRIHWTANHVFGAKGNKCALAYSKVQVECDICRACTIQAAGCEVHAAGKDPFDCNAALSNFFRAWSPSKKQWCCIKQGKGCEGHHPPTVDAGAGMVWKHVQINGYWTWQAVHGHGYVSAPYDCHAGLQNWHIGWSPGKKGWCCQHEQLGCAGAAAGAAGAGAAGGGAVHGGGAFHSYHGGSHVVHHVVHHYH